MSVQNFTAIHQIVGEPFYTKLMVAPEEKSRFNLREPWTSAQNLVPIHLVDVEIFHCISENLFVALDEKV